VKLVKPLTNQGGVVLVVALLLLLVLTLIGISSVGTATFETNNAGNERLYNMAFYAADGGIENFRSRLLNDEVFVKGQTDTISIGSDHRCNLTVVDVWSGTGGTSYKVRSEGVSPNFPVPGRVVIEAIIEKGGTGGGSSDGY